MYIIHISKFQVAAEQAAEQERAAAQAAAAAEAAGGSGGFGGSTLQFKILSGSGAMYNIGAEPGDTVGDLKARVEKRHGVPFDKQRLLYMGRELQECVIIY